MVRWMFILSTSNILVKTTGINQLTITTTTTTTIAAVTAVVTVTEIAVVVITTTGLTRMKIRLCYQDLGYYQIWLVYLYNTTTISHHTITNVITYPGYYYYYYYY